MRWKQHNNVQYYLLSPSVLTMAPCWDPPRRTKHFGPPRWSPSRRIIASSVFRPSCRVLSRWCATTRHTCSDRRTTNSSKFHYSETVVTKMSLLELWDDVCKLCLAKVFCIGFCHDVSVNGVSRGAFRIIRGTNNKGSTTEEAKDSSCENGIHGARHNW